jgi:hypothetical protein
MATKTAAKTTARTPTKSPAKSPARTPAKTPARTPAKTPARTPAKTTAKSAPKPAAKAGPTPLSAEEMAKLLALAEEADTVELKLTVPERRSGFRSTVNALGMDALDAQLRQVLFFDTPDLLLNKHGVVVRARRSQGRADDSVVKLRPVVPNDIPAALRKRAEFGVEVDALPGGYVCSASYKATLGGSVVRAVALGEKPIRKLFTKGQRAFFTDHAPEGIELDDLVALGPMNVLKLKFTPKEFSRQLVAELWMYPDGSRILELSTKCRPSKAFKVAAETKAFLIERGVDITGEQQTKTASALKFFTEHLRDDEDPSNS